MARRSNGNLDVERRYSLIGLSVLLIAPTASAQGAATTRAPHDTLSASAAHRALSLDGLHWLHRITRHADLYVRPRSTAGGTPS